MDWFTFLDALALMLILEGLTPFLSPSRWRNFLELISQQSDKFMRIIGLFSMSFGVILLYLVRLFFED